MSLKTVHILFITVSVLLGLATGVWGLREYSSQGDGSYLALGVSSLVLAVGLLGYGTWFLRKTRGIGKD